MIDHSTAPTESLAAQYERVCSTPSDIVGHLPTFVEIVREMDAQSVLELGTRTGVSTIAWLHGLAATGGHLTSVDIDEKPPIGEFDHWTFIQGDDLDPHVIARLPMSEVVFIDTSHLYEHTAQELRIYQHLVKPGGVMCLHDTELEQPEGAPPRPRFPVRTAIVEYAAEERRQWLEVPGSWGLGIIRF